ncbi:hypothetical protein HZY97_17750 [Sphingomonas sp. R-74633]|uniref:hypothetical protein n=1 Tax=Sphingomonas sp. R-74633 TaxID=2751188 RepID=UPI0015D3675A|nr:hypothetical protein [Sphingomonas sp. R-74633]NYT42622.1 hypothetical protein [Sphingomonas sp. R-74633]
MALWTVDLTTQDGAESAAQLGSFACFIAAGLTLLSLVMTAGLLTGMRSAGSLVFLLFFLPEAAIFAIAGFRLRAGRGLIWGGVGFAILLLELLLKITTLSVVGIIVNTVLLIGLFNGLRGAAARRGGGFDSEDAGAIFE